MLPTEPLPLRHSWPLSERGQRFNLGYVHACEATALAGSAVPPIEEQALARRGIGMWGCDLSDNSLTWSAEVYDIFGLPRDARVTREESVALYCEKSRAMMERLRAYAIKHRRGFTLDAEIRPAQGGYRWMRLMAAPICDGGRVIRLYGLKQNVSHE